MVECVECRSRKSASRLNRLRSKSDLIHQKVVESFDRIHQTQTAEGEGRGEAGRDSLARGVDCRRVPRDEVEVERSSIFLLFCFDLSRALPAEGSTRRLIRGWAHLVGSTGVWRG